MKKVKRNKQVKRGILIALLLFFLGGIAFGAVSMYGPEYSKETKHQIRGYFEASGVNIEEERYSYALWHDVRYKNTITGEANPPIGYLPTTQYDLIEQPGDSFGNRRGYHVIPLVESVVKKIAQQANGNPDYVWRAVNDANGTIFTTVNKYFNVDDLTNPLPNYISFGSVISLCGGGNPSTDASNLLHGVDKPVFQTTYQMTPWPAINEYKTYEGSTPSTNLTLANGQLKVNAITYSTWNNALTAYIVKGHYGKDEILKMLPEAKLLDPTFAKKIIGPVSGGKFNGFVPISQFKSLLKLDGTANDMTLVVMDPYQRISTAAFSFTVNGDLPNSEMTNLSVSPAQPAKGGAATIKATVKNDYALPLTSAVVLTLDGQQVGSQTVTLDSGETRTISFPVTMPNSSQATATATINPGHDQPNNESTYADNSKTLVIPLDGKLNLSLIWNKGPAKVGAQSQYSVDVDASNDSFQSITTTIRCVNGYYVSVWVDDDHGGHWEVSWETRTSTQSVTIPPKSDTLVTFSGLNAGFNALEEEYNSTANFSLNDAHNPEETTYADNQTGRSIPVTPKRYIPRRGIFIK